MTFEESKLFDYVEQLQEENLKCPICNLPLEDPYIEPLCGVMFCQGCIEKELKKKNNCPKCGKSCILPIEKTVIPKFITNKLDDLKVLCNVCKDKKEIRRADFIDHLENYCKTPCKMGCGELLTKSQIQTHNLVCKKYPVVCRGKDLFCKWNGLREQKESHENSCPYIGLEHVLSFLLNKIELLENNLNTLKEKYNSKVNLLKD